MTKSDRESLTLLCCRGIYCLNLNIKRSEDRYFGKRSQETLLSGGGQSAAEPGLRLAAEHTAQRGCKFTKKGGMKMEGEVLNIAKMDGQS